MPCWQMPYASAAPSLAILTLFNGGDIAAGSHAQCAARISGAATPQSSHRPEKFDRRPRRSNEATDTTFVIWPPRSHMPDQPLQRLGGARTALSVPMLREDAIGWHDQHISSGRSPLHRQANRVGAELCHPGRHRHREFAAAQRIAAIAAAADRDRRRAQGHQPLDLRSANRSRYAGESAARLCDADNAFIYQAQGQTYRYCAESMGSRRISWITSKTCRSSRNEALVGRTCLLEGKVDSYCRTSQADPEYTLSRSQKLERLIAPCSACRCCARAFPLACCR